MNAEEPVGTVAEEAAKLFAALHTWAGGDGDDGNSGDEPHEHATSTADCRWCPLCHLARMATSTSPEVRDHLTQAGLSFVLAIKALLENADASSRRDTPVEKIDLSEG